jgi:hypothetical protein
MKEEEVFKKGDFKTKIESSSKLFQVYQSIDLTN